jgi:hypothetical protein
MKIVFLFVTCLLAASAWSAVRSQSTTITQPASAAPIIGAPQVDAPVVVKPTAYLPSLPPPLDHTGTYCEQANAEVFCGFGADESR